jgi:hypothetical protein
LIQNGEGYKEHAVIRNIRSFPRICLLFLSVLQNAVAKDNFNNTEVKKLRAKSWFKQLEPGLLTQRPGFSCMHFHGAFKMMMDNGQ